MAGCGTPPGEHPDIPTPSTVGASAKPSSGPPAWRVNESVQLPPTSRLDSVVAVDATHAWAGGGEHYSMKKPGSMVPVILRWDGHTWSREKLPDRLPSSSVMSIAAESPTNVWALGAGSTDAENYYFLLHYDGAAWRKVPFPVRKAPNWTTMIDGLAVRDGHTWLIGEQGDAIIFEWDGRTWRKLMPPQQCNRFAVAADGSPSYCNLSSVVAFAPDDVWIGGNGKWSSFEGAALFHWNGTSWRFVDVGVKGQYVITAFGGRSSQELWAIGNLFNSGTPLVVKRDGDNWRMMAGLADGLLPAITIDSAGHPWVISSMPNAAPRLMRYTESGKWANTFTPGPTDPVLLQLEAITAVPGSDRMFAVGTFDLPTDPITVQAVILEYSAEAPLT
jgi:hypothetical protein